MLAAAATQATERPPTLSLHSFAVFNKERSDHSLRAVL